MDLFTLFQNYGNSGMISVTNDGSVFFALREDPFGSKSWFISMCSVVCFAPLWMYHLWPSTPVLYINPDFGSVSYLTE